MFWITYSKLLKLLFVVCGFGWQTYDCKNYIQNICSVFIPSLQFTEIYITSFWSGGFTTPTAVNGNLGNSIFVHFEMTFLTTLTGILDFANLIFQTGIFSQFKLGKKSNWIFQTGECQKFLKSQCR